MDKTFKGIEFHKVGGNVSFNDIEQFEEKFQIALPEDYSEFLKDINGGTLRGGEFILPNGLATRLNQLYSLKHSNVAHYQELEFKFSVKDEKIPTNAFPIGRDDYGNSICMKFNSDTHGSIHFFDSEFDEFSMISPSFSSFLENLKF